MVWQLDSKAKKANQQSSAHAVFFVTAKKMAPADAIFGKFFAKLAISPYLTVTISYLFNSK